MMKSILTFFLFLAFTCSALGQKDLFYKDIFYWTDTSTNFIDHRIVSMIENDKHIYALSKSMDARFDNPHPSFSRIGVDGKLKNFTVYKDVAEIYALNAVVLLPSDDIRIYGTCFSNNKFVPYINTVTPEGTMAANNFIMVSVPHFVGDAKQINKQQCVWAKSIRGSATNLYNAFVYRIDMANNDNIVWKAILTSEFNEECSRLVVLPDTSVLLLAKRYTDETFLSWVPVIYKMDPKGTLVWKKELTDFADFIDQNIAADENFIYYCNSLGNETSGTSSGNLIKLDQKGEILKRLNVEDINPTGVLALKSGKVLLYGGVYKPDGSQFIKKAKVVLCDNQLAKIKDRMMGEYDKPDSELPGMGAMMKPTSSDFLCAIVLSNGRVALGGRVYMPLKAGTSTEMMLSPRSNRNLLLIAGEDGTW